MVTHVRGLCYTCVSGWRCPNRPYTLQSLSGKGQKWYRINVWHERGHRACLRTRQRGWLVFSSSMDSTHCKKMKEGLKDCLKPDNGWFQRNLWLL